MNIYWLRPFWFGEVSFGGSIDHPQYHTIRFANRPNIEAQIWLTIVSPGATFSGGAVTGMGSAAVGIKSYTYADAQGQIHIRIFDEWIARVRVERIVDLTVSFHVRLAWAKADGMIYYWE